MSSEFEDRAQEDKEFDEYLRRDSEVSQRYRAIGGEVPPALDHKVLERARQQAARHAKRRSRWLSWGAPLAVAACALIAVSVVLRPEMQQVAAPVAARAPAESPAIAPTAEAPAPFAAPLPREPENASLEGQSSDGQSLQRDSRDEAEQNLSAKPKLAQDTMQADKAAAAEPARRPSIASGDAALSDAAQPRAARDSSAPAQRAGAREPAPSSDISTTAIAVPEAAPTIPPQAVAAAAPPAASTAADRPAVQKEERARQAAPPAAPVARELDVVGGSVLAGGNGPGASGAASANQQSTPAQPAERKAREPAAKLDQSKRSAEEGRRSLDENKEAARLGRALSAVASPAPMASATAPPEPARDGESTLELDRTYSPELWVVWIRQFRADGNTARAEELLKRLQAAHPDFKVPIDLLPSAPR